MPEKEKERVEDTETVAVRVYREDHEYLTRRVRHGFNLPDVIHELIMFAERRKIPEPEKRKA